MKRKKEAGPITSFIFGVLFTIIGYFVGIQLGMPILTDARESEQWPSVQGEIIHSKVIRSKDSDGGSQYSADVLYKYKIEGNSHENSEVSFGSSGFQSSSSGSANDVVRKYRKGQVVDVYYEPDNPGKSVLEPGTTWKSYFVLGIGVVFFVVGVLLAASSILKIVVGGLAIAGVLGALLGKKKRGSLNASPDFSSQKSDNHSQRPQTPHRADRSHGDGIDIA